MLDERKIQKRKRDLGLLDWLGRPTLVIELQYPSQLSGKSILAAQKDVRRLFRFVGRQHLVHFTFVQLGGFQTARKAKFHFHLTASTIEDLSREQLETIADDLRTSWEYIIAKGNTGGFDASDVPCVAWTIDEYVAHYRSKNGTSPLVNDDEVIARKMGYNFDGHSLLTDGEIVSHLVCPKPRRKTGCCRVCEHKHKTSGKTTEG